MTFKESFYVVQVDLKFVVIPCLTFWVPDLHDEPSHPA